ncbi:MAG: class I SAM-dependent methyltransferase [Actinomycetota bacterium]
MGGADAGRSPRPAGGGLQRVPAASRALDLGTGTGLGARLVARTFPDARVVGLDLAEAMAREAAIRGGTISYLVGDGAALPFPDAAFDLVTALNVFVFWDEVSRILAPGGALSIAYSAGESTPIFLSPDELRRHLSAVRSFRFEDGRAGRGIWVLARS